MGMPIITASTTTREQAITDLIQSVALQKTALSHILNADYGVGAGITPLPPANTDPSFVVGANISKLTGILTNHCWRFVPAPPSEKFDHIYTDQELYDAFNLPQKYRDVIEAVIKERK